MKIHELKSLPPYFEPMLQGQKTSEIRLNDRGFKLGDCLHLREYRMGEGLRGPDYTGRELLVRVTHVSTFHQADGWVVMSVTRLYACQPDAKPIEAKA